MAKHPVPFSPSALLLAPLVIMVPAAILLGLGTRVPMLAFGIFALISYFLALAMLGCLLLPALWLTSRVARFSTWLPPVMGGLIAAIIDIGWDYLTWSSSGVDSGPPSTTYRQWVAKFWFTPEPYVVTLFGAVTGAAYIFLATRKPTQSLDPTT